MAVDACPSDADWGQWVGGLVDDGRATDMEAHLTTCEACLGRVRTARVDADSGDRMLTAIERLTPDQTFSADEEATVNQIIEQVKARRGVASGPNPETGQLSRLEETYVGGGISSNLSAGAATGEHRISADSAGSVELEPVTQTGELRRGLSDQDTRRDAQLATPVESELVPGLILGAYKLVKKLGQGGMGMVFLAEHQRMERLVALKVLPPSVTKNQNAVERFHREVKAMARLSHPNIVTAFDADEARGLHILVMEYVDGQDLAALVKKRGPLSVEQAVDYIVQGAKGLEYAHKRGLVHRDIKPSNFLVDTEGQVKILDLGLARFSEQNDDDDGPPGMDLTGTGVVVGTVDYMSPEQAEDTKRADARADIYSLGCSLFYLISGRSMFGGDTVVARLLAHQNQPIPSLRSMNPSVPEELERIHRKMVAKKKEERYQTATALLDDLRKLAPEAFAGQGPRFAPDSVQVGNTEQTFVGPLSGSVITGSTALGQSPSATASVPTALGVGGRPPARTKLIIGAAAAALFLLFGWVIVFRDKDGKEVGRVKGTGPVSVTAKDGGSVDVQIAEDGVQPGQPPATGSSPGGWHGWPADSPKPAIAPFDAAQARRHQDEWAAYLKVPVEYANSLGMKFRLIPPGEFLMGSTKEEIEAALKDVGDNKVWATYIQSESPQHRVILTQPIYLGEHEVTQAAYETVMGVNPSHFSKTGAGKDMVAGKDTSGYPVETVGWIDAVEFCSRLSQRENLGSGFGAAPAGAVIANVNGGGYRLPGEAEWEFACRAGTITNFWTSDADQDLPKAEWFRENAEGRTHTVGELRANPFGLADMHGNVLEWVRDDWDHNRYSKFQERPAIDPVGQTSTNALRVTRGGVWSTHAPSHCRSSSRRAWEESTRGYDIGFRVSLSVAAVKAANNIPNGAERALAFDGVDDHMEIPRLMLRKEKPITVEAWLTPQTWKHSAIINISGKRPVSLYLDEGTVGFWCLGSKIEIPAPATLVGRRIHVAGVYDEKNLTVYLNGKPSAKIKPLVPEGGEPLMAIVGAIRDWENNFLTLRGFFHGQLHAIRVSETVRYTAEFNPPTELGSDAETLACYQFQAGHGDTVRDLSSHQFDGKVIGARWVADNLLPVTGWPADAPKPAIAPFDAAQAKQHQEEWAAYLKVPVEYTNSIGMKFRLIPPGEFTMGASPADIDMYVDAVVPNEDPWLEVLKGAAPQHRVVITKPMFLGMHEVTQSQFVQVMGYNPSFFSNSNTRPDRIKNTPDFERTTQAVAGLDTGNHPVEGVTYLNASEFLAKLSLREGLTPCHVLTKASLTSLRGTGYRFPTDAQWEMACRAGTAAARWCGPDATPLTSFEWHAENSGGRPHEVGQLNPNAYGLSDMLGNVREYVDDRWVKDEFQKRTGVATVDPEPSDGDPSARVVRGADWNHQKGFLLSSVRWNTGIDNVTSIIGFRAMLPVEAVIDSLARQRQPKVDTSGWPADAPKPAIAPFDAAQAKKHQEEWAAYLKVPVEYTNSIGMKLRLIPPGKFLMGSNKEQSDVGLQWINAANLPPEAFERSRINEEGPQHAVTLSKPFCVGGTEVTVAQFRQFVEASKYLTQGERFGGGNSNSWSPNPNVKPEQVSVTWRTPGFPSTDDHPVTQVTWADAVAFCNWLSERESLSPCYRGNDSEEWVRIPDGTGYRLPTEAEWEYACRAGTTTHYSFGDDPARLAEHGWVGQGGPIGPRPVAQKGANPFGLFDMHGNLREWCHDWYSSEYYAESSAIDPTGPDFGSDRVMRGGRTKDRPVGCRSAFRYDIAPFLRNIDGGFRVVRAPPPPATATDHLQSFSHVWSAPENLGPELNSKLDDTGPHPSADGLSLVFASKRPFGHVGFELWESRRKSPEEPFGVPTELPRIVNSIGDDDSPFLGANGLELLFASNRPGTKGDRDLYVCRRSDLAAKWGAPKNLGAQINTAAREDCPALSPDGLTLYFASSRSGGHGGMDIWSASRPSLDAEFGEPANLGPAINTSRDESSFAPLADSRSAVMLRVEGDRSDVILFSVSLRDGGLVSPRSLELGDVGKSLRGPRVSSDGMSLYFHATLPEGHGAPDLWRIRRIPKPPPASTPVSWNGWPKDAPAPAVAPFDAVQAKTHQEAWAKYLKVPSEYTNALGMKFRLIPPGQFVKGSSQEEIDATIAIIEGDEKPWKDRVRSEGPRHPVTITRPYYLGVTEVTQGEYEKIIGKNPAHFSAKGAGRKIVKDADTSRQPVETVNWYEALEFCKKLAAEDKLSAASPRPGEPTGRTWIGPYSLPTEAEWEFAARAGTVTSHWTGPDLAELGRTAWYIDHGEFNPFRTYPVGQLEGNPLGLCDMYGNVWEWTLDGYEQNHFQTLVAGVVDPTGPNPPGNQRVQRGGAGGLHAMHCRSSNRGAVPAEMKVNGWGFRVALSVDAVREKLRKASETTALGFDGPGDRVEIADLKWDPTKALTLEAWCLPTRAVGQGLVAGFAGECELRLRGRHWWFGVKDANGNWREVVATADASFKTPMHVAGVWNGSEIRLFYDGVRHGEPVPCQAPSPKGVAATLGAVVDGSQAFAGRMLQVRVSTAARYVDDFDPAPVLETDGETAALYRFETETGETVPDLSGNNRTGSLRGAKWTTAPRISGTPANTSPSSERAGSE